MFRWLTKLFSKQLPQTRSPGALVKVKRGVQAHYDVAQDNDENRKHWSVTDDLGAKSDNEESVRKVLRERARYEIKNNSYARGMSLTVANDLVGTGPRLQAQHDNKDVARAIEERFIEWAGAITLADKLRVMRLARYADGEPFGLLTTNPALPTSVKLDMRVIECDQFADPTFALSFMDPAVQEGIRFDAAGNPVAYHLFDEHPGDAITFRNGGKWIPARSVIHWFRRERPGQIRGIPEITPALPLFAQLRRYTLSVIACSEVASDVAGVIQTDQAPDTGVAELVEDFSTQEITRRMLLSLPPTYKLAQFKAEQPVTTYAMFKREILTEIARCLDMPYSIAAGDGSDSSYAGGRLEFQSWAIKIRVERADCESVVLNPLFRAWLDEAVMIPGLLPAGLDIANLRFKWFWDSRPHVDPQKEASALKELLAVNGTTLAAHHAARGDDWEDVLAQRAKEKQRLKELGLTEGEVVEEPVEPMEEETADAA